MTSAGSVLLLWPSATLDNISDKLRYCHFHVTSALSETGPAPHALHSSIHPYIPIPSSYLNIQSFRCVVARFSEVFHLRLDLEHTRHPDSTVLEYAFRKSGVKWEGANLPFLPDLEPQERKPRPPHRTRAYKQIFSPTSSSSFSLFFSL